MDEKDIVVKLDEFPQQSVGAPCPVLTVGDHHLHLAYYLSENLADWDGKSVIGESAALVEFKRPYAHMFGYPNEEALPGHPLYSHGLAPFGAYEIRRSSWIRQLEQMNSVHPAHKPEEFELYRHFVFTFHDRTFECVAKGFSVSLHQGRVDDILTNALDETE